MKFAVVLAVSLAISQAAEVKGSSGSSHNEKDEGKNQKRTLAEGNAGVKKRTPDISVAPTPNIEYADNKESHQDKSPTQQIYLTPAPPQVEKISDVVTQGRPFPAAIASHLYSPVSVYQARLGSPTTYEISAPVASQLAYSEHKIYQPASQNSIQYFNSPQKIHNLQGKTAFARLNVPYQQPEQPLYVQPQVYSQQQNQIPQSPATQAFVNYIPQVQYTQQQPQIQYQPQQPQIQYTQPQITYAQNQVQQQIPYPQNSQISYAQNQYQPPQLYQTQQSQVYQNQQPQVIQIIPPQPQPEQHFERQQLGPHQRQQELQQNALFVRIQQEASNVEAQRPQPAQRELKQLQIPQSKILNKPSLLDQQNVNDKPQGGAVSYASFSQGQPSSNYIASNNYQQSYQTNSINTPNKITAQQQIQQQHYEQQQRELQLQQYQQQYQQQSQQSQQYQQKPNYQIQQQPIVYVKPEQLQNLQNYLSQPQIYQQNANSQSEETEVNNTGYLQAQSIAVAPTFAPVQYYGKFAQNVFGSYHQQ